MADAPAQKEIFRFVSVRAPQLPDENARTIYNLTYGNQGEQPLIHATLLTEVQENGSQHRIDQLALDYIDQHQDVMNTKVVRDLLFIHSLLVRSTDPTRPNQHQTTEQITNSIRSHLDDALDRYTETRSYKDAKSALWGLLYAITALDRHPPSGLWEKLLATIQTITLLTRLREDPNYLVDDPSRLRHLLDAMPLLPKDLFPIRVPQSLEAERRAQDTQSQPRKSSQTSSQPGVLSDEQVRNIWNRVVNLDRAREELNLATESVLLKAQTKRREQMKRKPLGPPQTEQRRGLLASVTSFLNGGQGLDEIQAPEVVDKTQDPLLITDEHIAGLSETSIAALDAANIPSRGRRIPEVSESIDDATRKLSKLLFRGSNTRQLRPVGDVFQVKNRSPKSERSFWIEPTETAVELGKYMDLPLVESELPRHLAPGPQQARPSGVGEVRVLGIGDLLRLDETLLRYKAFEVSRIENVLSSEKRKRTHRVLNRSEELFETERTREEEKEKDLESTDRFEMQKETEETIKQETDIETGVKVTGKYGTTKIASDFKFARNNSRAEATREARNYAKETTERTVNRINKTVRERQQRTIIQETEETNKHGFDNSNGDNNISGIYRWLNKEYEAQLMNYGRRLLLEFMVPEPAAFYRHIQIQDNLNIEGVTLEKWEAPALKPSDLTVETYENWVDRYKVKDVSPPPSKYQTVSTAINTEEADNNHYLVKVSNELELPPGYVAETAHAEVHGVRTHKKWGKTPDFTLTIGRVGIGPVPLFDPHNRYAGRIDEYTEAMNGERGTVPVGISGHLIHKVAVTIEVVCKRTSEALATWQMETYRKIIESYQQHNAEYENQVQQAMARKAARKNSDVMGNPPHRKLEIEREELKKHCLSLLTDQNYELFDAIISPDADSDEFPEINFDEAKAEGDYVAFFEQAFEWDQMAYTYYPYFWGRKSQWADVFPLTSDDAQFTNFLRAGYARVEVPVRPQLTRSVLYYLNSGEIWSGSEPPTLEDDEFISIVTEIMEAKDFPDGGIPVEEAWTYEVPTSLVWLQNDSQLPDFTS